VIGNHKPALRNVDDAAKRRFNIVPFTYKPQNPDRELEQKLRDEWPSILRWMIDGCLSWQRDGLKRPQVVINATAEYFSEQDTFKQWVEDCCEIGDRSLSETTGSLFHNWSQYAIASGEQPRTKKWFGQELTRIGCEYVDKLPGCRQRGYLRIRLIQQQDDYRSRRYQD
jgi:phage/plasmid-associated DNA primase